MAQGARGGWKPEFIFEGDEENIDNNTIDPVIEALLSEAHTGVGGKVVAPKSSSEPVVGLYNSRNPAQVVVQGNFRLTDEAGHDVRPVSYTHLTLPTTPYV